MRWFTPAQEVDLCGHATLASAHVLYERGLKKDTDSIQFFTRSGTLTTKKMKGLLPAPPPPLSSFTSSPSPFGGSNPSSIFSSSSSSPSSLVMGYGSLSLQEGDLFDDGGDEVIPAFLQSGNPNNPYSPVPTNLNNNNNNNNNSIEDQVEAAKAKLKQWIEEDSEKEKDLIEMDFPIEKAIETIISDKEEQEDKSVESCLAEELKVLLAGLQWKDELKRVKYMGKNRMDLLVEVDDESLVLKLKPLSETLAKVNARCVIVTAKPAEGSRPGVDFISRVFAPSAGVPEGNPLLPAPPSSPLHSFSPLLS